MQKRALVVGLGIAGMSAAIGLRRAGWTPVIVERAPERRTGGYFVGLFPEGRQAAVDLGIADHLHTRNPERAAGTNAWSVDRRGRRRPALGFLDQPGGPAAVLRGDIEAALWQSITGVEVRFATTPVAITEGPAEAQVLLEHADTGGQYRESFDLVIGADGMRSSVRRMVFGPHEDHLTTWNAMICAFQLKEQAPTYEASDSIIIARAKRAVWVFGLADHAPTALLTYRTTDIQEQFSGSRLERLRAVFSGMDDPTVRHVLDSLEEAPDHVFDSVHQVRMPRWSTGRVVLVGDAAWCMNLYSGMGATSSLRGGAALGAALQEHPDDLAAALDAWEAGLRPFITKHQRAARLKQQMFVPSSRRAEALRSVLVGLARRVRGRQSATESGGPQDVALSGTLR
ncbi:FAD-dependent monooxygenase [Streptomyces violaceoruber]|nr:MULTISPECIES: FAD-dependent monooxygenase [Streptomyces]WTE16155.1 FAD-dependent monooxygenase [Streptomyces anthocyanicus]MDX2930733.1 FAD-dependent monooxygenase [Streptomyces sp. NRRL_B-16638]MDX3369134.1 FAD-dependent monooxygenase [Streptomyces sp. ME02-6987-2C]MDX3406332.1 FAD-dependent monooxygenase [Streptomyces sp. ME02-6977A]MDX3426727.1 FAD-dependent monooxygenase [Streptomyces sp. ME02-6985-2c]